MSDSETIRQLIAKHMPTAAVSSGWASAVDPAAFVAAMSERFPADQRPADLGITKFEAWLKGQGIEAGKGYVRALREAWLMERMRESMAKGAKVVTHADPAN